MTIAVTHPGSCIPSGLAEYLLVEKVAHCRLLVHNVSWSDAHEIMLNMSETLLQTSKFPE